MSCSLYKVIVEDGCFSISNPLLSINHSPKELIDILNITSQLDSGDKLIILHKKDVLKAKRYIRRRKYIYNYVQHIDYILDSLNEKEFGVYYVDGV